MSEKMHEIVGEIVSLLEPLDADNRARVVRASLVLLGEGQELAFSEKVNSEKASDPQFGGQELSGKPERAQIWMRQNGVGQAEIEQIFHVGSEGVTVISAEMPGKNGAERTINAYLLCGIQRMLAEGSPSFDDKTARTLCEKAGCYDGTNHSKYMKTKGNLLTGSKGSGWELTAPGQKRAANLIKEMASFAS